MPPGLFTVFSHLIYLLNRSFLQTQSWEEERGSQNYTDSLDFFLFFSPRSTTCHTELYVRLSRGGLSRTVHNSKNSSDCFLTPSYQKDISSVTCPD